MVAARTRTAIQIEAADYKTVLSRFPNQTLAARIFTTLENGRIDWRLRSVYRGIRRDLDFVRSRLIERRPKITDLTVEQAVYELLFQITLCGGVIDETARRAYAEIILRVRTRSRRLPAPRRRHGRRHAGSPRSASTTSSARNASNQQESEIQPSGEPGRERLRRKTRAATTSASNPQQQRRRPIPSTSGRSRSKRLCPPTPTCSTS